MLYQDRRALVTEVTTPFVTFKVLNTRVDSLLGAWDVRANCRELVPAVAANQWPCVRENPIRPVAVARPVNVSNVEFRMRANRSDALSPPMWQSPADPVPTPKKHGKEPLVAAAVT
jgi:hypothetical protein